MESEAVQPAFGVAKGVSNRVDVLSKTVVHVVMDNVRSRVDVSTIRVVSRAVVRSTRVAVFIARKLRPQHRWESVRRSADSLRNYSAANRPLSLTKFTQATDNL